MPKLRRLFIRVSTNEYERIKNKTHAKGYSSMAAYLRSISLGDELITENKITENNMMIKEILQKLEHNPEDLT